MNEKKAELRDYILSIINKKTTSELVKLVDVTCDSCHYQTHHPHFGWGCSKDPLFGGGGRACDDYNSNEMEEWRKDRETNLSRSKEE
jgi:hypothetical protein